MDLEQLKSLHERSAWHGELLKKSLRCGCFYCLYMFPVGEIETIMKEPASSSRGEGETALCPRCGIDSVLPDYGLGIELSLDLLEKMQAHWFYPGAGDRYLKG